MGLLGYLILLLQFIFLRQKFSITTTMVKSDPSSNRDIVLTLDNFDISYNVEIAGNDHGDNNIDQYFSIEFLTI